MDRFGLFVDAGYLLSAGGVLCLGTKSRAAISCDYAGVHQALVEFAGNHCGLPVLRTYWYDGAVTIGSQPQPTTDHLRIAALPNLKLRLGRISGGQQKGVDSLVMRDLMTLSRERAVSVVYLLSGDDDLREGVTAAQDFGVQVFLLGVPGQKNNQAVTLVNECDGHTAPDRTFWAPYFSPKAGAPETVATAALPVVAVPTPDVGEATAAHNIGVAYCEAWLSQQEKDLALLVAERLPIVPKDIDAPLLRQAEGVLGSLRVREDLRRDVRNGFVDRLRRWMADEQDLSAEAENAEEVAAE